MYCRQSTQGEEGATDKGAEASTAGSTRRQGREASRLELDRRCQTPSTDWPTS